MARAEDWSIDTRGLSGRGQPGAAAIRFGLPCLAAAGAAGIAGIAWSGVAAVAAATGAAIWLAERLQARRAPGPARAFREFCGVVSAQLGVAVATSAAGAEQTLRATGAIGAALDTGAPDGAALAVQDIWAAQQHHGLLRQNLEAVQVALNHLAETAPDRLFDPEGRVFERALADLRAAYVMEAQRAADGGGEDAARPASPAIELF